MKASGVLAKTAFVFGQMNEPPGARQRVGLSGLTMAEYFRDEEGRDVLLFIDNIFRFTQAGSEVSALLGRMPSAVGYQPNLATEMAGLQERITSTNKGSITSQQAVFVPADDYTDPAPATTSARTPRSSPGDPAMTLHLEVVTPERLAYEDDVDMVLVPGIDGELGILPHHTPLVSLLGVGELEIRKGGSSESFAIAGGFVQVRPDKVVVMAETADLASEIDLEKAQEA